MMSLGNALLQTPENENAGNKRMPCPLHGCKRVYKDTSALESHIKDHEIPATSLPGKVLLCSSSGCGCSFTSMQKLMDHMRLHHKPNIYFQCESCRTKLRTYRNLLGHLHTCSKVPRGKPKDLPAPPASAVSSTKAAEQPPPRLESMSSPPPGGFQLAGPAGPLAAPQLGPPGPPGLGFPEAGPPTLTPLQLGEPLAQPLPRTEAFLQAPSLTLAAPRLPLPAELQAQLLSHTRPPDSFLPAAAPASSPPGSTAVWKKNQGVSCSSRVLWEHTRGRYTCVQCGHTVTNRKEMTQHISSKHGGNRAAEETGGPARPGGPAGPGGLQSS